MKQKIYVIECQQGKYYVGKSKDVDARLSEHFTNNGSERTKLYKPIKVVGRYNNCDVFDEDKYTIKMMEKYGVNNVRGGSFVIPIPIRFTHFLLRNACLALRCHITILTKRNNSPNFVEIMIWYTGAEYHIGRFHAVFLHCCI